MAWGVCAPAPVSPQSSKEVAAMNLVLSDVVMCFMCFVSG